MSDSDSDTEYENEPCGCCDFCNKTFFQGDPCFVPTTVLKEIWRPETCNNCKHKTKNYIERVLSLSIEFKEVTVSPISESSHSNIIETIQRFPEQVIKDKKPVNLFEIIENFVLLWKKSPEVRTEKENDYVEYVTEKGFITL